jgi:hypothetical protein
MSHYAAETTVAERQFSIRIEHSWRQELEEKDV